MDPFVFLSQANRRKRPLTTLDAAVWNERRVNQRRIHRKNQTNAVFILHWTSQYWDRQVVALIHTLFTRPLIHSFVQQSITSDDTLRDDLLSLFYDIVSMKETKLSSQQFASNLKELGRQEHGLTWVDFRKIFVWLFTRIHWDRKLLLSIKII